MKQLCSVAIENHVSEFHDLYHEHISYSRYNENLKNETKQYIAFQLYYSCREKKLEECSKILLIN